jgi:hypothetical protein
VTIDLKQFCAQGSEAEMHSYLAAPFSFGEHTYATNGHVAVRVARRDDIAEAGGNLIKSSSETLCKAFDEAKSQPLATFMRALPAPLPPEECEICEGGTEPPHDCPDCECECEDCDGTGKVWTFRRVRFSNFDVSEKYLRMLAALPGLHIGTPPDSHAAVLFSFDGGSALLMPMRRNSLVEGDQIIEASELPSVEAATVS